MPPQPARAASRAGATALLVGLFLAATTLRPQVVGIGPLLPDVQHDLDVSHAVAGLLITIPVLCMGLFAPVAAGLAARLGAVRAVTTALLLLAAGGVARSAVPGIVAMLLLTLVVGAGMGLGNALMVVAVKERFADRPLLVTGIYSTGIQTGSAASAAIAVPVADASGGWRTSLLVFSAAAATALLVWHLIARRAGSAPASASWPRLPGRSKLVWLLVVLFVLLGVIYYGITAWLPDAYVEKGFTQTETGWLAAIFNAGTLPSSILVAVAGHRVSRRRALLVASSAMVCATTLLVLVPGGAWGWMLLAGLANGALFALSMSLPLEIADTAVGVGAVAGMMLLLGYTGIATAPFVLGAIRDLTGGFDVVLALFPLCALGLVGCCALLSPARLARGVRSLEQHG